MNMRLIIKSVQHIGALCAFEVFLIGIGIIVSLISKTYDRTGNYVTKFMVFGNTIMLSFIMIRSITKKVVFTKIWQRYAKIGTQLILAVFLGSFLGFKILLYNFWFDYTEFEIRNILITNFLVTFFISGIALLRVAYIREKQSIELEYQKHRIESQLMMTYAKLKPHFLFNTLNSLVHLGYKNQPEQLENVIRCMSKTYRNIIDLPEKSDITIREELRIIEDYIQLEKIRLGERLSFECHVEEKCLDIKIPPLLIEVLIENAVIHGVSPKTGPGTVSMRIGLRDDAVLEVTVSDDGVGFDMESGDIGFGIGSVYKRLKNSYGDNGKMIINSKLSVGTTITLEVTV